MQENDFGSSKANEGHQQPDASPNRADAGKHPVQEGQPGSSHPSDQQPTAPYSFAQQPTEAYSAITEEQVVEGPSLNAEEAAQGEAPKRKEYWYQRIGRSVGASIAACAGALAVVALVSGASAFAGAHLAYDDPSHDGSRMERSVDKGFQDDDAYPDDKGLKGDIDSRSQGPEGRPGMDGQDSDGTGPGRQGDGGSDATDDRPAIGEERNGTDSKEGSSEKPKSDSESSSDDSASDKGTDKQSKDSTSASLGGSQATA